MILVSGSFTFLARLAGAIAGKTLGWAVVVLFGRVPQERARLLSLIALAAAGWLVAVVALLVPAANRLVAAAVPRPGFVNPGIIGWALIAGALFLPAVVGAALTALGADGPPPTAIDRLVRILRGYAFTPALALVIVFLAVWSVARALRAARPGRASGEIPIIVKPGAYELVVDDVAAALRLAAMNATRHEAPPWFLLPPRLLAAAGGVVSRGDLPKRLLTLRGDGLEVLIYPSAVTFHGRTEAVAAARAAVARQLAFAEVYLTTAKEAEEVEDWLRELFRRPFAQASDFEPIDALLRTQALPPDDWDIVFRLRYQVEHEVLVARRASLAREA